MTKPRKSRVQKAHIPSAEKYAAALLMHMRVGPDGNLVRSISHEEAKTMTAAQIIARFDIHHWPVQECDGGPAKAWNLTPMLREDHRKETGKLATQRAKGKRIRAKYNPSSSTEMPPMTAAIFGMLTDGTRPKPKRKGRPMPGSKASPLKRTMRGKTVLRSQHEARP